MKIFVFHKRVTSVEEDVIIKSLPIQHFLSPALLPLSNGLMNILAMVVTVTGMCRKVPKHHLGSFDGQVVKRNVVIILRENHS